MRMCVIRLCCVLLLMSSITIARRHRLVLKNDGRDSILCSQFGFLYHGTLTVNLMKLEFHSSSKAAPTIGFTLDKAENAGIASYLETKTKKCVLTDQSIIKGTSLSVVYLKFDFKSKRLLVDPIGKDLRSLTIMPLIIAPEGHEPSQAAGAATPPLTRNKRAAEKTKTTPVTPKKKGATTVGSKEEEGKKQARLVADGAQLKLTNIIRSLGFKTSEDLSAVVADLVKLNVSVPDLAAAKSHKALQRRLVQFLKDAEAKGKGTSATKRLLQQLASPTGKQETDAVKDSASSSGGVVLGSMRNSTIPLHLVNGYYSAQFIVVMANEADKGLYSLYFHNCDGKDVPINMTLSLVEKNENSYLSAGEQPLPLVYFAFCGAYFILSWVWLVVLRTSKKDVFKIHYVMLALVFVKSIALLFHGVNNYVLGKEGIQEEGWAVMYYITYLMRGSLMLITLILIGAGWTYVKHMLHDREKKILLVGMSLHALRFVANIIIDESEIGSARYTTWKEIFILVDLLSVGLVLFPIVWSIRHLTKASRTDGKAAINLRRLKLFRHFYLLVICFIYTSRIIAYLLEITIPFTHTWLVGLFREGATLVFFVITGYKFRPFNNNPYLLVPNDNDEEEDTEIQMEHVVSQSGFAENTTRVNRSFKPDDDSEIADASPDLTTGLERPPSAANDQQVISHEED